MDMMKMIKYRYFIITLHVLAWSIILLFPYFISSAASQYKIGPLPGYYFTLSGIIHMALFYGNTLLLYPKLLTRTYWWVYVIAVVLLILVSVRLKFYILARWFPDDLQQAQSHILFPSMMAFIISIFYSITTEKFRAEKQQKEKEALQLAIELKFLRSQISPHFLFNILTNLVSLARKRSDNLETSLLMLSGLMRYMLYNADRKISVQQELEYLENYIALQKLRSGPEVKIIFNSTFTNEATSDAIEPMLLIPFVENAFKHGTGSIEEPLIDIKITSQEGILVFHIKNTFDRNAEDTLKEKDAGIGLSNVRSRLALLYPHRHDLVIQTDNNLFEVYLKLKLL